MAQTSLVTGGAGFLGSHLVDELIRSRHEVVVLDDLSGGFVENVNPNAKFIQGSITDQAVVEQLFEQHAFDFVFHMAAYAAEGLSHFIRRFNYTNNVIGSMNLINAAVNFDVQCFVFASSIAVYGHAPPPVHEEQVPQPVDPYGIAKYAVELDLKAAHNLFGLNYVIFRPHNIYGVRQNTGDRYRNVVGIFMNQALNGKPLTIFGDGTQTRAFTEVSDVVPAIAHSVENPDAFGQIFNIGADTPYSINELAERVQHAMGVQSKVLHLEPREEVLHAFADHAKARHVLDCRSSVSLEEGLARMAEWVKSAGVRHSRDFDQIEVEKELPSAWARKD